MGLTYIETGNAQHNNSNVFKLQLAFNLMKCVCKFTDKTVDIIQDSSQTLIYTII